MQEEREVKAGHDIKIISSIGKSENAPEFNTKTIDELFLKRNIYVVSVVEGYCPDFLLERYNFEPEGDLWLAVKKE